MKTAIEIIIFCAVFLYIGNTKITINPFSFKIQYPSLMFGILILGIGLSLIGNHYKNEGKKELLKQQIEAKKKQIKEPTA